MKKEKDYHRLLELHREVFKKWTEQTSGLSLIRVESPERVPLNAHPPLMHKTQRAIKRNFYSARILFMKTSLNFFPAIKRSREDQIMQTEKMAERLVERPGHSTGAK